MTIPFDEIYNIYEKWIVDSHGIYKGVEYKLGPMTPPAIMHISLCIYPGPDSQDEEVFASVTPKTLVYLGDTGPTAYRAKLEVHWSNSKKFERYNYDEMYFGYSININTVILDD